MAIIITLFKQKGGAGATTIAALLYEAYRNKGVSKICIVDCDPQRSITTIAERLPALGLNVGKLEDLEKLEKNNDLLIIDTPPSLDPKVNLSITKVLPKSDLIILPVRPSVTDALSLQPVVDLIKDVQKKHKVKASILINQLPTNNTYNQTIVDKIREYGLPIFTSTLGIRIAYSRCFLAGGIYKEKNKKAIKEVEHLANEAYTLIAI